MSPIDNALLHQRGDGEAPQQRRAIRTGLRRAGAIAGDLPATAEKFHGRRNFLEPNRTTAATHGTDGAQNAARI
jgi:hypothetical protein